MANPYEPPRHAAVPPHAEKSADDADLSTLEFRKRACGTILGFVAISMGAVAAVGALRSLFGTAGDDWPEHPLLGIAGLPLFFVGALGLRGKTASFYGGLAMALLWLACSAYSLYDAFQHETTRTVAADGLRLILLLTSGWALLFLAMAGTVFELQICRKRRSVDYP